MRETEMDISVRLGLLRADARQDRNAILSTLYAYFDRTLGRTM